MICIFATPKTSLFYEMKHLGARYLLERLHIFTLDISLQYSYKLNLEGVYVEISMERDAWELATLIFVGIQTWFVYETSKFHIHNMRKLVFFFVIVVVVFG